MTEGVDVLAEGIQLGFHAGEQVPAHDDGEAVVGYALACGEDVVGGGGFGQVVRKGLFYPLNMNGCRLSACAMAYVNRELVHAKTILHQVFPKLRRATTLRLRFNRQIEHHIEPHQPIGIKCVLRTDHESNSGKSNSSPLPK